MGTCSYKESFPEVPFHPTQSLVPNRCSINDRWVSPALSLETGLLPHLSSVWGSHLRLCSANWGNKTKRSGFQQIAAGTLIKDPAPRVTDPQVTKHIPRTLPAISRFTGNGTGAKAVPSWSQQLGLQRQVTLSMCRKHNAAALTQAGLQQCFMRVMEGEEE